MLLERDEDISLSVSVTTRPKRPGEVDGRDYHFVDPTEFNLMLNRRELLEHAKVFDHYYGTPQGAVEEALSVGKDVLFDIDWQGEQQLKQATRNDLASVFILPPSTEELARRLQSRAQDPADVVAGRMAKAPDEISHWPEYDYIIVNYDIEESVAQVQAVLAAERLKRERQVGLTDFVKRLREWQ
jgi:guanylate kinase